MMGRYEDALESLDMALDKDALLADAYKLRGEILESVKNYDEAMDAFNKALKTYDKLFTSYNDLSALVDKGKLYEELGRFQDAMKTYDTALDIDDSKGYLWKQKAELHIDMEEYREALVAADKGLQLENSSDFFILMGRAFDGLGNKEKARNFFQKASEEDGADARVTFAGYLSELEEYEEALEVLEDEDLNEKLTRANILSDMGEFQEAAPLFKEVIHREENSLDAWFGLGKALFETGDMKGASKAYDTCIGLSEDFGPAWYDKALIFKAKGDTKQALEYANIATDLGVTEAVTLAEELGKKV